MLPYKHSSFFPPTHGSNAAASPASRRRSAGSLAIIFYLFRWKPLESDAEFENENRQNLKPHLIQFQLFIL